MTVTLTVLLTFVYLSDLVRCYNVDVNFPILYKGPDRVHFGYTLAIREDWLQVGAPKDNDVRNPSIAEPGAVYRCPFKRSCVSLDINSRESNRFVRKQGSWLGGAMDVSPSTHTYAVCSHRKINEKWVDIYYMTGGCYWGRSRETLEPRVLTPLENHETYTLQNASFNSKPLVVFDWGNGLAGMSVHIPTIRTSNNMQVVIGAPGVFNLRGAAILYDNLNNGVGVPIVTNPYTSQGGPKDDDYVGYQVSSGYFYDPVKLLYVASAPRSGYKGKVILFEFSKYTRDQMYIKQELVGKTIGEYFGASLATGDIDGDNLDDLIVGAPQWSRIEDEGQVYVYMGSSTGRLAVSSIFAGTAKGAMFGSAVQILGDIDGDGYNDLAVGAPYDDGNRGAVYIYYGSSSGLSASRSFRIAAKTVSPNLRGFGVSFSKAEDLDRNGYRDFAVGSFISGHAVLLRSRPVMDIVVSITTTTNSLDHSATQFEINLCVMYSGAGVPSTMELLRNISADAIFGRVTLANTGRFQNEDRVRVTKDRLECDNILLDLKAKNNFDPIEITSSFKLLPESNFSNALVYSYNNENLPVQDSFCSTCPVMRLGSKSRASTTISFASNCGNDGECTSNLQVRAKFNGTVNGAYILGSETPINLEVEVYNAGESAYSTQLHIQIPKPVDLESIPSTCQQDDDTAENSIAISCFVANPLYNDKTYSFVIPLDLSKVGASENYDFSKNNKLMFNVSASTISSNINSGDNTKIVEIVLKNEFDITVTGKTPQDALSYDTPDNETAVEILKFQHHFAVQKFGASPVHEAYLTVMFPYAMQNRKDENMMFLVVYSKEGTQDGQPLQCTSDQISYQVDNEFSTEDFDIDSYAINNQTATYKMYKPNSRKTRDVSNVEAPPENRTLHLTCESPLFNCYYVKCRVGPFIQEQTVARLTLSMAMNVTVLKEILGDHDVALFTSAANVIVARPENLEQTNIGGMLLRPDDFILSTLFIGSPKNGTIAPWIIALAVAVGLLLLCLIIVGLFKAGFFKRKTKEEMEALKEAEQQSPGKSEEEALAQEHDVSDKEENA